jgi:hypothetical protein
MFARCEGCGCANDVSFVREADAWLYDDCYLNAVGENYFEVTCLHDGARWKLALENVKEFCLLY